MHTDRLGIVLTAFVLVALAFVACSGCVHSMRPTTPLVQVTRTWAQQAAASVEVTSFCPTGAHNGSGVALDSTHVLTAMHVAACAEAIARVTYPTGETYEMRVSRLDYRADVAELVGPSVGQVVPVSIARVMPGQSICFESSSPTHSRSCGHILPSQRPAPGDLNMSAPTQGGNSGSGVYDARGRLVGIVSHRKCPGLELCPTGGLATSLAGREWLALP